MIRQNANVKIPASAVRMLIHILEEMARGNAVTLIPVHVRTHHAGSGGASLNILAAFPDPASRRGENPNFAG